MMQDYQRIHPEVTVIDPPDAIQRLRNRQSMLEVVADLNLPDSYGIFRHHLRIPVKWYLRNLSLTHLLQYVCYFLLDGSFFFLT